MAANGLGSGANMGMNLSMGGPQWAQGSNGLPYDKLAKGAYNAGKQMMGPQQQQGGGGGRAPTSPAEAQRMQEIIQRMKMQGGGRSDWAGLLGAALGR